MIMLTIIITNTIMNNKNFYISRHQVHIQPPSERLVQSTCIT